ncbi:hypothetical protein HPB47_002777 [Ixodes persulcatus]|uniref:Uncharacterized protein n=1 Tax=Ixodes persulcatus TaxID=34615 RepID=A0AC60PLA0_IXOPE|nr:hypothetical protein HPB47_002777 [Ixodes persulcatus]
MATRKNNEFRGTYAASDVSTNARAAAYFMESVEEPLFHLLGSVGDVKPFFCIRSAWKGNASSPTPLLPQLHLYCLCRLLSPHLERAARRRPPVGNCHPRTIRFKSRWTCDRLFSTTTNFLVKRHRFKKRLQNPSFPEDGLIDGKFLFFLHYESKLANSAVGAPKGGVVAVGAESVTIVQTINAKPVSISVVADTVAQTTNSEAVKGGGMAVGRERWGSMVGGYGWSSVVGCDLSHSWGGSNQRSSCCRCNWSSRECYCWCCSNMGDWSTNDEASRSCDRVSHQPRGGNDATVMDEPAEDRAGQSQEKEGPKLDALEKLVSVGEGGVGRLSRHLVAFLDAPVVNLCSTLAVYKENVYTQRAGVCISSCLAPMLSELYVMCLDMAIETGFEATALESRMYQYAVDYLIAFPEPMPPESVIEAFALSRTELSFKREDPSEEGLQYLNLHLKLLPDGIFLDIKQR